MCTYVCTYMYIYKYIMYLFYICVYLNTCNSVYVLCIHVHGDSCVL